MKTKATTWDAYQLMHCGSLALARMEHAGIRVDTAYMQQATREVSQKIADLKQELMEDDVYAIWKKEFGNKTKLSSRPQLGVVLFDKLGIPSGGYTEKSASLSEDFRRYRTDEKVFEGIDHPFVKKYFQMQHLAKLLSTYLVGISKEVVDGYLHPSFSLHMVISWRSASQNPNFQNIPIRNPEVASYIRRCFIPRKGRVLVEIDFSGAEVRICYCYHKDPTMEKYLLGGGDLHKDMACQIYKLKPDQVSKNTRNSAKASFVFAQFYGDYYAACARNLWTNLDTMNLECPDGTPVKQVLHSQGIKKLGECDPELTPRAGTFERHVKDVEDDFWGNRFRVFGEWRRRIWNEYQETGRLPFFTGFVGTGLMRRNQILNLQTQGCAFHCLLWCLIEIQDWLDRKKMKTKQVAQIHDSILFDVPESELQDVLNYAHHTLTVRLLKAWDWIIIPMEAEVEVCPLGGSWFDKKPYTLNDSGIWTPQVKA